MRHKVKGRKLGRSTPHRKATLQALSVALIMNQRIETTVAKAKELRRFVEPLITTAKEDTTHNRRKAFRFLQDKNAVKELFENVGPAAKDRPGGYTRVLKLGFRLGDSAEMAMIELVDFNDVPPELKTAKQKRTRRAGKSNKPTSATPETGTDSTDSVEEKKEKKKKATSATENKEKSVAKESSEAKAEDASPESNDAGPEKDSADK